MKKVQNKEKFIAFFMDEEDIEDICVDFKHGYYETLKAIESGEENIYTTQLSLLKTSLFRRGYKVYVREKDKDMFEIKLGTNERTNKEIKECHNLEKMLIAGNLLK